MTSVFSPTLKHFYDNYALSDALILNQKLQPVLILLRRLNNRRSVRQVKSCFSDFDRGGTKLVDDLAVIHTSVISPFRELSVQTPLVSASVRKAVNMLPALDVLDTHQ